MALEAGRFESSLLWTKRQFASLFAYSLRSWDDYRLAFSRFGSNHTGDSLVNRLHGLSSCKSKSASPRLGFNESSIMSAVLGTNCHVARFADRQLKQDFFQLLLQSESKLETYQTTKLIRMTKSQNGQNDQNPEYL